MLSLKLKESAMFGAVRKYDIHTGIDLWCLPDPPIYAMRDGIVIWQEVFTGPSAGSPWWNDTFALAVQDKTGITLYGEIQVDHEVDLWFNVPQTTKIPVKAGQLVGTVMTVLKKDKGVPTTMLHLERYMLGSTCSTVWNLGEPQPRRLLDPTQEFTDEEIEVLFGSKR